MKNKKYLYSGIFATIFCALIVGLGWVYIVYSSPGTTTIGENISTDELTTTGTTTLATTGGNVGIGTTTPGVKLEVSSDDGISVTHIRTSTGGSPRLDIGSWTPDMGEHYVYYNTQNSSLGHRFQVLGASVLTIDNVGNVDIGNLEVGNIVLPRGADRIISVEGVPFDEQGDGYNLGIVGGNSFGPMGPNYDGGDVLIDGGSRWGTGAYGDVLLATQRGSVGIGTTTVSGDLQVWDTASTTVYIGDATHSGCLVMGDSDNGGVTYITVLDGVLTATTTKPDICK